MGTLLYNTTGLADSGRILHQYLRDNTSPTSTYRLNATLEISKEPTHNRRILMYTPIGCTFDERACKFFSGCAATSKVCDRDSQFSCDIRLPSNYTYDKLGDKNYDIIEHMCRNNLTEKYDMFVKMDDDLLVNMQSFQRNLDSIDIAGRSMLGFLRQASDGVIWPQGALYAFTAETLQGLCRSQEARDQLKGKHEDVNFGRAMATLGDVSFYNIDAVANIYHLQYQSSRLFVQYLQYGKCT
ncbi:hypothetical protein FBU59_005488 [Linderina macrospora]|uniref:Uncharacterized protein n=1 Tax=Linderina macrospora TaxID=4868 RepID=A0ACC1J2U3_9FUNG|nr:hypothetical protein FBU59_005488 [Linderina macrospora]